MYDYDVEAARMQTCREIAAQAWCTPTTSHIVLDYPLAEAFAEILRRERYQPALGCATTRELLDEIKARVELDGKLDYRTVD